MSQRQLTGSRIRERRMMLALRQTDLAREVGISASYLNLIEHNRRRIGGKLLLSIARALGVEPSTLTEGAEAALIATLREARAADPAAGAESEVLEDFAGRFPGWAQLLERRHRRVLELERTVETLSDRMTHDPHLAAALHEMISTITAIRSTASILAETRELEPEWRDRFHRNINEDADRLAHSAKALVGYLDSTEDTDDVDLSSPQDELDAFLGESSYHMPVLEEHEAVDVNALVEQQDVLQSAAARAMARTYLNRYVKDAQSMPLPQTIAAVKQYGLDPSALARHFDVDLASTMRRLAEIPEAATGRPVGLVSCDASGTMTFRKALDGFMLPRFGAACPLWPLFRALSRPMLPVVQVVQQAGRGGGVFRTYSIAQPTGPVSFDAPPLFEAYMMILPLETGEKPAETPDEVGVSCRICPREACPGRREPSILTDGF
ncbi:short-chain fatty acyl-CoA regulator family protein [Thalassovita sp.]|uniref:short-chain fatty acyl-CoA regulator family protein n=1 Tax=Thalassovita sp. TaxID=1979401 RepID=UPI00288146D3|nr:short-chain fatty acyl-CoA regulator family protein [Thalassovita sp.]MDF1803150.1 short-chain fatty acyl-CoA regulator family protein [Thalassovita sp.]